MTYTLIHTGQYYSESLNGVFFEELDLPAPDHNLGVGSKSHGAQTGEMIAGIEDVLVAVEPDGERPLVVKGSYEGEI